MINYKKLQEITPEIVQDKNILLLVDYNVPINNQKIEDTYRIEKSLHTLKFLLKESKQIIISSHLGRPSQEEKNLFIQKKEIKSSLLCVFEWMKNNVIDGDNFVFISNLQDLKNLHKQNEVYCNNIENGKIKTNKNIVLLENIRLYDKSDLDLNLQSHVDLIVNDAFSSAHRSFPFSINLACYSGFLIKQEIQSIPEEFELIILGGKKVSDKMPLLKNLKRKKAFLAGGMAATLMKRNGIDIGRSYTDNDFAMFSSDIDLLSSNLKNYFQIVDECYQKLNQKEKIFDAIYNYFDIFLPFDFYIEKDANVFYNELQNQKIIDIGVESMQFLTYLISKSDSMFWNGPIGIFENEKCIKTNQLVECLELSEKKKKKVLVGGGETAMAARLYQKNGLKHISTGGGALLTLLGNGKMPSLDRCEFKINNEL